MKSNSRKSSLLTVLLTVFYWIPSGGVQAQTFKVLHSFSDSTGPGGPVGSNSDGARPSAGLLLSGTTLYGTASAGGSWGYGTVFKVNIDGTDFVTLHSFTPADINTNADGA